MEGGGGGRVCIHIEELSITLIQVQWDPSNPDTLGTFQMCPDFRDYIILLFGPAATVHCIKVSSI